MNSSHPLPSPIRVAIAFALGLLSAPAATQQQLGADVSVWDSSIPVSSTQWPVGGSGQVNGEFAVATWTDAVGDRAIQLGLRAQERFLGPTLPRDGATYFVPLGESEPGYSLWNLDIHADFGTASLADLTGTGVQESVRHFAVGLHIDFDPTVAVNGSGFDLNGILNDLGFEEQVELFQASENLTRSYVVDDNGTPVAMFPSDQDGVHDIVLSVFDYPPPGEAVTLVETRIRVVIGFPDYDHDGVRDDIDACPVEDVAPTVAIGDCDTGVPNVLLPGGCTIAQRLGPCVEAAGNHGEFVSCVNRTLQELTQSGHLSKADAQMIRVCAAQSGVGRKGKD